MGTGVGCPGKRQGSPLYSLAANNVGDNDIDDNAPIEPPLSRHEALQAKITIEKYIETIDKPYACKLESILADFAHSTWLIESQKMKASLLTDILHVNSYYYFN